MGLDEFGERLFKPFADLFTYAGGVVGYTVTGKTTEKDKKEKEQLAKDLQDYQENKGTIGGFTPLQISSLVLAGVLFIIYIARGRR
jgi:hypothetical protein